jgi:hypothetical protein
MKQLKSSWNNLEAVQHVGRTPKRGVSKPVSRQRRHVLVGTLGEDAADLSELYDRSIRRPNVYDY